MKINIYNTTRLDKTLDEFINNPDFKASGGSKYNYTDDDYLEIIRESIPNRLKNVPFYDEALSKEESFLLMNVLEERIKKLLKGRKPIEGNHTINFLGNNIRLKIPFGDNIQDNLISILYKSYNIIDECIKLNKPVYLSIFDEN